MVPRWLLVFLVILPFGAAESTTRTIGFGATTESVTESESALLIKDLDLDLELTEKVAALANTVGANDLTAPKIAVAIPTFGRMKYVQLCADALRGTIDPEHIWIFDDGSDAYGATELTSWFGSTHVQLAGKEGKLGPDGNSARVMDWFASSNYDWMVTLDSDLVVEPSWLSRLQAVLPRIDDGIVTLYHSGVPKTLHCEDGLCEMHRLGNAGVVWPRGLAKVMMQQMGQRKQGFDIGYVLAASCPYTHACNATECRVSPDSCLSCFCVLSAGETGALRTRGRCSHLRSPLWRTWGCRVRGV
jgi:hypothetical protein